VTMTAAEQAALLAESRKLQLANINRDGTPHLVTMYYVMLDGQIAFWTYRSAQKARNLARDPRATCLVETGEEYFDLRGVQVVGLARCIEDPARGLERGRGGRAAGLRADGRHWLRDGWGREVRRRPEGGGVRGWGAGGLPLGLPPAGPAGGAPGSPSRRLGWRHRGQERLQQRRVP